MPKTLGLNFQFAPSAILPNASWPAMHPHGASMEGFSARFSPALKFQDFHHPSRFTSCTSACRVEGSLGWAVGKSFTHGMHPEHPQFSRDFEIRKQVFLGARAAGGGGQLPAVERRSAFKCLTKITTAYNRIVILEAPESSSSEFAGCRVLLLDNSRNVQSIYKRDSVWTNFYWDEFASLPAIIPQGPVAIFGLGGGTAARILLELWPSLRIEGFEIDETVVEEARRLLGLSELEVPKPEGGRLAVQIANAFSPLSTFDGEFAGIVMDLFSEGEVAYELQQRETWLKFKKMLMPGGRIMVNCGGVCVEKSDPVPDVDDGTWTWQDGGSSGDAALRAMAMAFNSKVSWRRTGSTDNCLALSGPLPDLDLWAAAVPEQLRAGIACWRPYQ